MLRKLDEKFFSIKWPWPLILIMFFMLAFALIAYRKKHLTKNGSVAAFVSGVVVFWCSHFQGFILLCCFYFSSYAVGKYCASKRKIEKKGHTRDYMQVLANGLLAVIAALQYENTRNIRFLIMFGAVIAEATSDTWAGEIGRLSDKPPVSIRTFQIVPKGLSGGVTAMGFAGAAAGSFFIAIMWFILFPVKVNFVSVLIITFCGFAGCILDSFLGATCQAMYLDEKKDALTENDIDEEGNKRQLVRGLSWMDTDIVNLSSNIFAAMCAFALSRAL